MSETFEDRDMSGVIFRNVNLGGAVFEDVNLAEGVIRNANLTNFRIEDAYIKGMTVMGFNVEQMIEAELDRRDPQRARLRMADCYDPECVRAVMDRLGEVRSQFSSFLRATHTTWLTSRPDPDNWSVV